MSAIITGTVAINSPHAYAKICKEIIKQYLTPMSFPSFSMKNAWQMLPVAKAGIEITSCDKRRTEDIHKDMMIKYCRWATMMCDKGILAERLRTGLIKSRMVSLC